MDWHGYPQHPDARPERPWWRKLWKRRGDGSLEHVAWRRTDGRAESAVAVDTARIDILEAFDELYPLPVPPPKCRQVWMWPKHRRDQAAMITAVVTEREPDGRTTWCVTADGSERWVGEGYAPWPFPGAVLVAGPGAPWAPMRDDKGNAGAGGGETQAVPDGESPPNKGAKRRCPNCDSIRVVDETQSGTYGASYSRCQDCGWSQG